MSGGFGPFQGTVDGTSDAVFVSDEGTTQGLAINLDFVGAGVSALVSGSTATITIPGGTGVDIEDEGTPQGNATTINFVGPGVSASVALGEATITVASSRVIVAQTSNTTLVSGDSSKYYNNSGAGAEVQITLPSASSGLFFGFRVLTNQFLRVIAAAGDVIRLSDQVSSAAGYIRANAVGSCIEIECQDSTTWLVTQGVGGPWTVDS